MGRRIYGGVNLALRLISGVVKHPIAQVVVKALHLWTMANSLKRTTEEKNRKTKGKLWFTRV